jgi:hypothetical protein
VEGEVEGMTIQLKKKLEIEIDVIEGNIDFNNNDELSYIEILGALEYVKMMIVKDWMGE